MIVISYLKTVYKFCYGAEMSKTTVACHGELVEYYISLLLKGMERVPGTKKKIKGGGGFIYNQNLRRRITFGRDYVWKKIKFKGMGKDKNLCSMTNIHTVSLT